MCDIYRLVKRHAGETLIIGQSMFPPANNSSSVHYAIPNSILSCRGTNVNYTLLLQIIVYTYIIYII